MLERRRDLVRKIRLTLKLCIYIHFQEEVQGKLWSITEILMEEKIRLWLWVIKVNRILKIKNIIWTILLVLHMIEAPILVMYIQNNSNSQEVGPQLVTLDLLFLWKCTLDVNLQLFSSVGIVTLPDYSSCKSIMNILHIC